MDHVNLNASDGVSSSGSDYISFGKTMLLNNFLINDSIISNVVPFIGTNYAVRLIIILQRSQQLAEVRATVLHPSANIQCIFH